MLCDTQVDKRIGQAAASKSVGKSGRSKGYSDKDGECCFEILENLHLYCNILTFERLLSLGIRYCFTSYTVRLGNVLPLTLYTTTQ